MSHTTTETTPSKPVLVTGATGYIGGRLVPRLVERGYRVRCLAREPRKLSDRPWAERPNVEIIRCDIDDPDALRAAMQGCCATYYLVHSMMVAGADYRERDRVLARGFAEAAEAAGLERIIYLGGLGEIGDKLSEHLASRREVETALASGSVPVTVFRAAMIIGSGSASFEILRYLVERLPIMITPRWVSTEAQPIAVRNVLHYLVACFSEPATVGKTLDIGGPDIMTYRQIMQTMAQALGLRKRWVIPVPVLTPRLSSLWIHLVTPLSHRIARPLAEGLRNKVVCREDEAHRLMPQRLLTVRESIDAALGKLEAHDVETTWSDAGPIPGDPDWSGGKVFVDRRTIEVDAGVEAAYQAICRIGGGQGYYAADWLWRLRGWMDRLVGGPGLRRGRHDSERVSYGEALDFWRVTGIAPNRRLELRAEMKLPGEASLEFEVQPHPEDHGRCMFVQTARFKPRGLLGLAYWYAVLPLHSFVFSGMLKGIRRAAEAIGRTTPTGQAAPGGRIAEPNDSAPLP
ncbi:MAG: SDR family oxidoreductase [Phycisphaerae bacterium]|nr:SDR family oxidoreductase [Phycisphaerae bacterium]